MKNLNFRSSMIKWAALPLLIMGVGCSENNELIDVDLLNSETTSSQEGDSVSITNPGFEDDKNGWDGSFAISGDEYSGSSSAKLSSSSKSISQTVSVSSNTNYTLSAYILGGGTLGATVNGADNETSGDYSDWTKVSVAFNSGSSTSVTIYGDYNSDEGRFDDFELIEGSSSNSSSQRFEEMVGKTVRIENVASDLWLRIKSTGDYAQAEVVAQTNTGTWPRWVVEEVLDNDIYYYRFVNVNSNRRFRPETATSGADINMGRTSWTGNWTQWQVTSDGNGNYTFKNRSTSDYLNAGDNTNGAIAKATSSTDGNLTTWRIEDLNGNDANGVTNTDVTNTGGDDDSDVGSLLNNDIWKITMPYDINGNDSGNVSDPGDRNNKAYEYFDLNKASDDYPDNLYVSGGEVFFVAHCGGATTTGSIYPRCELRQLDSNGGDELISFNNDQYLDVTVRAVKTPVEKPEVCMVQLKGSSSNEIIRVDFMDDNGVLGLHLTENEDTTLEDVIDYELGDRLRVRITLDSDEVRLQMNNLDNNDSYDKTWDHNDDEGYFKVGAYVQSATTYCEEKEKSSSECTDDDADAEGIVAVSDLTFTSN